jgi:hypothetical protein
MAAMLREEKSIIYRLDMGLDHSLSPLTVLLDEPLIARRQAGEKLRKEVNMTLSMEDLSTLRTTS